MERGTMQLQSLKMMTMLKMLKINNNNYYNYNSYKRKRKRIFYSEYRREAQGLTENDGKQK